MARTPATHNDKTIAQMLKAGTSVAVIAGELGVSEPTVYKAIRRLGLSLPSASQKRSSPPAPAAAAAAAAPATTKTGTARSAARKPSATKSSATKSGATKSAATKPNATKSAGDQAPNESTPGTSLVPIGPDVDLLTVRVDKGIELLKNLSARIVRHERELAAARQRYAETLEALALR